MSEENRAPQRRGKRQVWLFGWPRLNEQEEFGRWGILVTEMSADVIKGYCLCRSSETADLDRGDYVYIGDDVCLGTLWEVVLHERQYIVRKEGLKLFQLQEPSVSFSGQYMGEANITDEEIQNHGVSIILYLCSLQVTRILRRNSGHTTKTEDLVQMLLEALNPDFNISECIKALSDRWRALTNACYPPLASAQGGIFRSTSDEKGICIFRGDAPGKPPQETWLRNLRHETLSPAWINHFAGHSSRRRVMTDLEELRKSPVEGISVCFDGPGKLRCYIEGPKESPYEGMCIVAIQTDNLSRWSI